MINTALKWIGYHSFRTNTRLARSLDSRIRQPKRRFLVRTLISRLSFAEQWRKNSDQSLHQFFPKAELFKFRR